MKKITVFYFSGTGNTKYVCEKAGEYLKKSFKTEFYDITENIKFKDIIKDSHYIMIAYPIYGSAPPIPVCEFVYRYRFLWNNKKFIILITQYFFSGDGAASIGRTIEKFGGHIKFAEHINMPNNLSDFKIFKIKNGDEINYTILKANKKIKKFTQKIIENKDFKRGFNFFSHIIGYYSQRKWWRKTEKERRDALKIDYSKCILCKKCIKDCPVGNIEIKNNIPVPKNKCVFCYRCVNNCPKQAITLLGKNYPVKQYKGIKNNR